MMKYKYAAILAALLVNLCLADIAVVAGQEAESGATPATGVVDTSNSDCNLPDASNVAEGIVGVGPLCSKESSGYILNGETIHLCGPSGSYKYQWGTFIGNVYTPDGTNKCMDLVFNQQNPGTKVGAILSVTNDNGLKCADKTCIKYTVARTPCCPLLDSFCKGEATQANADTWVYSGLPTGYSYKWYVGKLGTTPAAISMPVTPGYLNTLAPGLYHAYIKIYHNGNVVKDTCGQYFLVETPPVATITPT
jgi:hypothetical protein